MQILSRKNEIMEPLGSTVQWSVQVTKYCSCLQRFLFVCYCLKITSHSKWMPKKTLLKAYVRTLLCKGIKITKQQNEIVKQSLIEKRVEATEPLSILFGTTIKNYIDACQKHITVGCVKSVEKLLK